MAAGAWSPRLSGKAGRDLAEILQWTRREFGTEQARIYQDIVVNRIETLRGGPSAAQATAMPELGNQIYKLRLATRGRKARHILYFELHAGQRILILRILHDSMDPTLHVDETGP